MDQKIVVMMSRPPGAEEDMVPELRALFAELQGCELLSIVQKGRQITITLVALELSELVGPRELRAFVSILTDRVTGRARLDSVRSIAVGGALEHVNKILGKKP
jgi:hypothetical protein